MSNVYELMVLAVPQAATDGKEQAKDKVEALITKQKGKILNCDEWGERFLAYPVKKYDRGVYLLYSLELTGGKQIKALDTKLALEPTVLRHLVVKKVIEKKSKKTNKAKV